ncbi:MAG: nitroreductase [Verrucomicrobiales bacterium]|nr:nitroreductase [Verrucomicrobiales bacterium]
MHPDIATITRIVRSRRSIKPAAMEANREIPRPLLDTLLENATWAPTHGITEPWHFTIFSNDSRRLLATTLQSLYQKHTLPPDFRPEKFEKLGRNPLLAPVVFAIGATPGSNPKIPEIEEIEAVACAVQNIHLTASAAGLGAFWSSPPITAHPEFVEFIGLAKTDRCLGLLYLGWPKDDIPLPTSKRRPAAEKTTWR